MAMGTHGFLLEKYFSTFGAARYFSCNFYTATGTGWCFVTDLMTTLWTLYNHFTSISNELFS